MHKESRPTPQGLKRRHHVVPESYLRRFANSEGLILVGDELKKEAFTVNPRNAAVMTDFYLAQMGEGPSDALEDWMGVIEARAASAFTRIADHGQELSHLDREALANFIALQITRGPTYRQQILKTGRLEALTAASIDGNTPDRVREFLRTTEGREPGEDEVTEMAESLRAGELRFEAPKEVAILAALKSAAALVQPLADRHWSMFEIGPRGFVTSDNPAILVPPTHISVENVLFTEELLLPVDPRHAISLTKAETSQLAVLDQVDLITNLNNRSRAGAYRFVFAHPDPFST